MAETPEKKEAIRPSSKKNAGEELLNLTQIKQIIEDGTEIHRLTRREELLKDVFEEDPEGHNKMTDTYNRFDWHNVRGQHFEVRQKDYNIKKARGEKGKAPSRECLYEIIEVLQYYSKTANCDPSDNLNLPLNPDFPKECKLPEYFILNVAVPNYEPGMWINAVEGPSTMLMCLCKLKDEAIKRWVNKETRPVDHLFERFLYKHEPPCGNYSVRRRMKCIVRLRNNQAKVFDFGRILAGVMHRYNGTPFLLRDSTSFFLGENWAVVTVDGNKFGRLAKNSLWQCRPFTQHGICDICMMVEGDGDLNAELEENVLFACRISKIPFFPDLKPI